MFLPFTTSVLVCIFPPSFPWEIVITSPNTEIRHSLKPPFLSLPKRVLFTDHLLPVSIILQKVSKRRFTFSFNFPNRLTFQKFLDFLVLFKRMLIQSFDKRVVVFMIQDVHFRYFQILQIFNILSG